MSFCISFLVDFCLCFFLASRQPGEGRRSPPARGDKIKMPTAAAAPRMRRPDDQSAAKLKLPGPPANGAGLMMEVVSTKTESSIPPLQTLAQPPPHIAPPLTSSSRLIQPLCYTFFSIETPLLPCATHFHIQRPHLLGYILTPTTPNMTWTTFRFQSEINMVHVSCSTFRAGGWEDLHILAIFIYFWSTDTSLTRDKFHIQCII